MIRVYVSGGCGIGKLRTIGTRLVSGWALCDCSDDVI
jgi:hypothetical protein